MNSNSKNKHAAAKARLREGGSGRICYARTTLRMVRKLKQLSQSGNRVRVRLSSNGSIVGIVGGSSGDALKMGLARFGLSVPPLNFEPFVSQRWSDQLCQWGKTIPGGQWLLLFGPEGTGKDTIFNLLIQKVNNEHEKVAILTLPPEDEDRYVGHLEAKLKALADVVQLCKDNGYVVILYLPEIESLFSSGDYSSSWEIHFTAAFRNVLDGTVAFKPDYVLASANNLYRLGGPARSRFRCIPLRMEPEVVRGILQAHWPGDLLNGLSCEYVLRRLTVAKIADVTHRSQKKSPLRAVDLTGLNGRFLRSFSADLRERILLRRDRSPEFIPDAPFLDSLIAEHLEGILAPLIETAGSRSIRELLVEPPDSFDPPVDVTPNNEWCEKSMFVA